MKIKQSNQEDNNEKWHPAIQRPLTRLPLTQPDTGLGAILKEWATNPNL